MSTQTKLTLPMPRLGETMEEGTIAQWLVQPGQGFKRGDPLLEIETDKTLVEYPALGDGALIEILAQRGDVVEVGEPIAVIETAEAWEGIESQPDRKPETAAAPAVSPVATAPAPDGPHTRATPLARRIAKQAGIDLKDVAGTGRRGRIEAGNVQAAIRAGGATVSGKAAGQVYFVHGFAGLGSNWAALRARLQRGGHKALAPDLPGHGANKANAPDVAALVDWLAEDLAGLPAPVHLVGHSLGAHVAAQATLRDPSRVSRLTLIAPAGCGPEINGSFTRGMALSPGTGALVHLMELLGPKAQELDTQALSAMADSLKGDRLVALAGDMGHGDTQGIDTIAPLNALADLQITAIFGLSDQIIPRDHVFNLPPHVACHMVKSGHMPHWDSVEDVANIIVTH